MSTDANFKLKLKNRKLQDVDLSEGWAYFVVEKEYKKYYQAHADEAEVWK
jgi:hypothetical protein